ncbi:hypothetical protein FBZ90_102259 [Nitrospirillum pindoramense]|uniref:PAS domain-containing protein n=2 Tax=Nitrospirillum amazonense TaxID=28077 RepID=A0A560HFU3_9PROT|nr:hypothetical protein FBZ90_102259 [Nitrospirillum amazonense]
MTGPAMWNATTVARFPLQIQSNNLRLLHDYWEIMRGDRAFPETSEVDVVDLPMSPGGVMLVDVAPNQMAFTLKWVGTDYVLWLRRESTGLQLEDLPPSPNTVPFAQMLRRAADNCQPQARSLPAAPSMNIPAVELVVLPLGGLDGKVARLLVGCAFDRKRRGLQVIG